MVVNPEEYCQQCGHEWAVEEESCAECGFDPAGCEEDSDAYEAAKKKWKKENNGPTSHSDY